MQAFEWHRRFREGRESVEDGRPQTSRTTEYLEKVSAVVHNSTSTVFVQSPSNTSPLEVRINLQCVPSGNNAGFAQTNPATNEIKTGGGKGNNCPHLLRVVWGFIRIWELE
ncbi:hypothetical protein TNCV_3599661 [Trichonephila clavipes]|nr:hypothetical protein TNCV_3599661 [Trichonephila clavipes]